MRTNTIERVLTFKRFLTLSLALGTLGAGWSAAHARTRVPAGTAIDVRVDSKISTENNDRGDRWTGVVDRDVVSRNRVVIPAGSRVEGVVTTAAQGTHDSKAHLGLAVRRVYVEGRGHIVNADTPPIVAGSRRAKKIGAIAGGAAVGALLGKAVGDGKGAVIGGLLGGAAGYGATRHALRTLQIKSGTVVTFTTRETMIAMR
jgi:hypothetical protein